MMLSLIDQRCIINHFSSTHKINNQHHSDITVKALDMLCRRVAHGAQAPRRQLLLFCVPCTGNVNASSISVNESELVTSKDSTQNTSNDS